MFKEIASMAGKIIWYDLTVSDVDTVRDFYQAVVGWQPEGLDMGGYDDVNMKTPEGEVAAGLCHAKGVNADIPPQWMIYITVDNLDTSLEQVIKLGGKQVTPIKEMGGNRSAVIQDPAGAVCTLFETAAGT
jgi:predicted enzyme related to lactoylglutathione lyase